MGLRKVKTQETAPDIEAETAVITRHLRNSSLQPFAAQYTSVGMEFELQVAVAGDYKDVDLPQSIHDSGFFRNTEKRASRGDLSPRSIISLRDFLYHNDTGIWENSWVRLKEDRLGDFARKLLNHDFLADKSSPEGPKRSDLHRFYFVQHGERWLRIPVSYLLKLTFADAIGSASPISPVIFKTGKDLLSHFLSDNTSPEILSFTIPKGADGRIGRLAARESARTFLIGQILIQYANTKLGLLESGQKCLLYNAPHAPHRQKKLNEIVPGWILPPSLYEPMSIRLGAG